uniref:Uncharacterized protein n=1 Tax=Meloidogyne enterolobii TaxID=390850 RepID=A0A6V7U256_MELEN|nr:unnamed protein product [Meloidogyne enterolobii]
MDGIQAKEEILKVLDELNNRLIAKETELHNLIESNAKLLQRIEQLEESNRKLRNKINRGSSFWKDLFAGSFIEKNRQWIQENVYMKNDQNKKYFN